MLFAEKGMHRKARLLVAMQLGVGVCPSVLFSHLDNRVGGAGIEIARQYLNKISGILCRFSEHHLCLLLTRVLTYMIKMKAQHAKSNARLFFAKPNPVHMARPSGVPRLASADMGCFRQPVRSCGNKRIAPRREKDRILRYAVIPGFVRVHLRPFETKGKVVGHRGFQVFVLHTKNFLKADDVRLLILENVNADFFSVAPAESLGGIFLKRDPDIRRENAMPFAI